VFHEGALRALIGVKRDYDDDDDSDTLKVQQ